MLVAARCVEKLIFGYVGNPGIGLAPRISAGGGARRGRGGGLGRISRWAAPRLHAGALGVPFLPAAYPLLPGDLTARLPVQPISCPFTGEELTAIPALTPDVAIVHAHRADEDGNVQSFARLLGDTLEGANASRRIICTVEQIVPRETIRGVPDRTIIPGFRVSSVSVVPWGAYPSYVDGIYGRERRGLCGLGQALAIGERAGTWIDTEIRQHASFADYVAGIGLVVSRSSSAVDGKGDDDSTSSDDAGFVSLVAREIRDSQVCFVGIGVPSLAAMASKRFHAPKAILVCNELVRWTRAHRFRPCRRAVHR